MRSRFAAATLLLVAALLLPVSGAAASPLTPTAGGTSFLNHAALLGNAADPAWYEANIPFLDVPDQQIQSVYYYRWQTYREHLVYTGPVYGWMSSEFLQPADYGAPYGGIDAAAGHQITEGRWLRDQQYVKDDIDYWLAGPGQFPKPRNDNVNPDTGDWAHEYSFWAASAVWQQYLAAGDLGFTAAEQQALIKQYNGWADHYDASLGLYWQVPVWDATEFTPSSYESGDGYRGGVGYRPTINAYQFGDATAIAQIAALTGDSATANDFTGRAASLRSAVQSQLWDPSRQFFYGMPRDNNPSHALTGTREEMGFVPWMFDLPTADDTGAFAQLKDPDGFAAPFGPTTAERRSPWFMHEAADCCRWDGPSWPYETSQTLTGAANLLQDYPPQSTFTAADYVSLLHTYAATQYRDGQPYVAEAHDPDQDRWIYDGHAHSEDYNHSTYNDNVISGLIGLRGQPGGTLTLKPLAPASWDYFALENTPYHGHNVTVLWDRTGSRYGQGAGLHVYVDGAQVAQQSGLDPLTVPVGAAVAHPVPSTVDIAANGQRFGYGPQPSASYTSSYDNVWNAVDGIVYRTAVPQNSRWTSYGSPNATDSYQLDFHRGVSTGEVRLWFYDDGGGVRTPTSYDLQYDTGNGWATVPGQSRAPATVNGPTEITFPALTTSRLRVVAPNAGGGTGWGLQEFEVYSAPVFQLANVNSGLLMGVSDMSTQDGAPVVQFQDNGTRDHLWQLVPAGGGQYKIRNGNSGLVLGVDGMSTQDSAAVVQYHDTGTPDHLWTLIDAGGGQFKIRNAHSGLLLGVAGMSTQDSAAVVQFQDNGTADHLWQVRPAA
ncbi:MGH1-like glycoside hydrolase domain-containing protein [Amycolatopsis saalfeldensis]|uniref:Ricin-type beta-trefoil lectin domain-like n=1 Tax=Amycolatopsis saalfeldensis TaxID=394193 RepID=A0A1H8YG55_9PSEU|nr:RICIN domain-containing protein [Amycolatopsis saalfeldensis]SEP51043.1 Ricin-type beta-trefoil lectin domain-like [Amycolatopsis saalfeldensis]